MKLRLSAVAALLLAPCPAPTQSMAPQIDLLDLWYKIPNKPTDEKPEGPPQGLMIAAMPIIGRNPTSGLPFGVAGQLAFIAGDPKTMRISSAVTSLSFSTKNRTLRNVQFDAYSSGSEWLIEGDNRLYKSGEGVYGLGTDTPTSALIDANYSWLRLHETVCRRVTGDLYLGGGLLVDSHTRQTCDGVRSGSRSLFHPQRAAQPSDRQPAVFRNQRQRTCGQARRRNRPAARLDGVVPICSGV